MDKKVITIDFESLEKIILELKDIEKLTPDGAIKIRLNHVINNIESITGMSSDSPLEVRILKKMNEARVNNVELHTKLYILYRNLTEGRVSLSEAEEMYELYLEMYPFDAMIY